MLVPIIPLRFMVPPSYVAEGGTGSLRRQPPASAANVKIMMGLISDYWSLSSALGQKR